MRFVLDNDVDAGVCRELRRAGHECWTAADAGLAGRVAADDDSVSVYAEDKNAVLITHDREFTSRRIRQTHGLHIRLTCAQPDGPQVIRERLPQIIGSFDEGPVLVVGADGLRVYPRRWE